MANAKLYRVILQVSDIAAAADFYSAILSDLGERVSNGRHYFDCDGTLLACFDPRADGDAFDAAPNPDHVYFAVSDLEEVHLRVKAARPFSVNETIRVMPWGERMFYAVDPFGNPIAFVDQRTVFKGSI